MEVLDEASPKRSNRPAVMISLEEEPARMTRPATVRSARAVRPRSEQSPCSRTAAYSEERSDRLLRDDKTNRRLMLDSTGNVG